MAEVLDLRLIWENLVLALAQDKRVKQEDIFDHTFSTAVYLLRDGVTAQALQGTDSTELKRTRLIAEKYDCLEHIERAIHGQQRYNGALQTLRQIQSHPQPLSAKQIETLIIDIFENEIALAHLARGPDAVCDEQSPAINVEELSGIYETIAQLPDSKRLVIKSIGNICDRFQRYCEGFSIPILLRFMLLFTQCPYFADLLIFSELLEVYRCVRLLPPKALRILKSWFENCSLEVLERQVDLVRLMFTVSVLNDEVPATHLSDVVGPCIRHGLAYLGLLYDANAERERRFRQCEITSAFYEGKQLLSDLNPTTLIPVHKNSLEIEDFYNDGINENPMMLLSDFKSTLEKDVRPPFDLMAHPFVLDASSKALLLMWHSSLQQRLESRRSGVLRLGDLSFLNPYLVLEVSRSNLVKDALDKLVQASSQSTRVANPSTRLKKRLRVVFRGEEGIDEGGVAKEFFQLLVEQLFNVDYGMFAYNAETHYFWFRPDSLEALIQFELIGIVFGLALYNNKILDVSFPPVVYKKLLSASDCVAPLKTPRESAPDSHIHRMVEALMGGTTPAADVQTDIDLVADMASTLPLYEPCLEDLEEFEPRLAKSLRQLLMASPDEVTSMCLTFSVDSECFGEVKTVPLNRDNTEPQTVTAANREEYIKLLLHHYLVDSIKSPFNAFYKGFHRCCGGPILKLFQPVELNLAICGAPGEIDFTDIQASAQYADGYNVEHKVVKWFWEAVNNLDAEQKKQLLFFITGSVRMPLRGVMSLKITIGKAGGDPNRIPTAHTCYNYLLLPEYPTKERLWHYLLVALEHRHGFGLL